jgi:hypothetical protein
MLHSCGMVAARKNGSTFIVAAAQNRIPNADGHIPPIRYSTSPIASPAATCPSAIHMTKLVSHEAGIIRAPAANNAIESGYTDPTFQSIARLTCVAASPPIGVDMIAGYWNEKAAKANIAIPITPQRNCRFVGIIAMIVNIPLGGGLCYAYRMKRDELHEFIKARKYLIWWVKDYDRLGPESIVEATLNYGNWDDVQTLIRILGMKEVAEIFRRKSKPSKVGRQNYRQDVKHYFTLYFNKHAPEDA